MDERTVPDPSGVSPLTRPLHELVEQHSVLDLRATLKQIEVSLIIKALERTGGVQTRSAELLGITFRQLRHKLKKHGLRLRLVKYR